MFKFLKRSKVNAVTPVVEPVPAPVVMPKANEPQANFKERRQVPRPLPIPDVVEGNGGETDWGLWEDAHFEKTQPASIDPKSSK